MKAIFLSDVHLLGTGSEVQKKVLCFMERIRGRTKTARGEGATDPLAVDLLVIAGDFFDFWFSRGKRIYPGFRKVVDLLTALKCQGVRIVICEGNHDFFLGEYFAGQLGVEVFPEEAELQIDGLKVLVAHGDTVDRDNRKYLALRKFLRSDLVFRLQQKLPLKLLWAIARLSSELSKEASGEAQDRLAKLMHRYARSKFTEGYDAVILGHCHKPLLVREAGGKTFATMGDWLSHDTYLSYQDGDFCLERIPDSASR